MSQHSERIGVIGTREIVKLWPNDYRVRCATCGAGGTVRYTTRQEAGKAAARDSGKPCPAKYPCGAR